MWVVGAGDRMELTPNRLFRVLWVQALGKETALVWPRQLKHLQFLLPAKREP